MFTAAWLSLAAEYRVLSPGKSTSFNKGFYKYAKLKIFRIWHLHIPTERGICVSLFTCCACKGESDRGYVAALCGNEFGLTDSKYTRVFHTWQGG
jgi:hypothetical protein